MVQELSDDWMVHVNTKHLPSKARNNTCLYFLFLNNEIILAAVWEDETFKVE